METRVRRSHLAVALLLGATLLLLVWRTAVTQAGSSVVLKGDWAPRWVDNNSVCFIRWVNKSSQGILRRIDTGAERSLVAAPYEANSFSLLPDGSALFTAKYPGSNGAYYLYRMQDKKIELLLKWDFRQSTGVRSRPDGSKVVFDYEESGPGRLYFLDIKSRELTAASLPKNVSISDPKWSPGGDKVAFLGYLYLGVGSDYPIRLYVADVDMKSFIRLTDVAKTSAHLEDLLDKDLGPHQGAFEWSPDGTRIAYERPSPSDSELWVADLSAKSTRRVVTGGWQPFWDRSGKVLFFEGVGGLYRLNLDSNKRTQIFKGNTAGASLSPDGKHLAIAVKKAAYSSRIEIVTLHDE